MGTPRLDCIAAVLPNNQMMVMGGYTNEDIVNSTDSVEFTSIE
jgi:type II secretory pathway component GspD/PulD (secretin)